MTIELRGPYLGNLGDALMVRAIIDRLGHRHTIAVRESFCSEEERIALGLELVIPQMVEAVLDCSGYAYGASWGRERMEPLLQDITQWKQHGVRVIFLPQTFGPFDRPDEQRMMRAILERADRVYAREPQSLSHVHALGVPETILKLSPDFTACIKPDVPESLRPHPQTIAIVPNLRMIDQTAGAVKDAYLPFLIECIRCVKNRHYEPLIVVHEKNDIRIAEELQRRTGIGAPVIHSDPQVIKGILGACHAVVASRYHAQIAALSQGVPVIGTGWVHKYEALFEDYDCSSCLLTPLADRDTIAAAIESVTLGPQRTEIISRITHAGKKRLSRIEAMWDDVHALLR